MSTASHLRHQTNDPLDSQSAEPSGAAGLSVAAALGPAAPGRRPARNSRSRSERIPTASGFVLRVHPNRDGQDAGPAVDAASNAAAQPASLAPGAVELVRLVERQQRTIVELMERLSACQVELEQTRGELRELRAPVGPSVSVLLDQSDRLQQVERVLETVCATVDTLQAQAAASPPPAAETAPPTPAAEAVAPVASPPALAPVLTFWQRLGRWLAVAAL
jgi:hypothetical protein